MDEPKNQVIEPEIIDENGVPVTSEPDHARPEGDTSGILGGFAVLAMGIVMTVLVAAFSLLVLCPLMLLGRFFGWEMRRFKK